MTLVHQFRRGLGCFILVALTSLRLTAQSLPGDELWTSLSGAQGTTCAVYAVCVNGSDVYFGGDFTNVAGVSANHIAHWDGHAWSALGDGVNDRVNAIAAYGANIYAGGNFTLASGVPAARVACWDGQQWHSLGAGVDSTVSSLGIASNGDLFAAGWFQSAGGITAQCVARWNGSSWSDLGGGVFGYVRALAVDGNNLYVGGSFRTVGSNLEVTNVARWNGSAWSPLGGGVGEDWNMITYGGDVYALAVGGGNLYAGGAFTNASGPARRVARWDGTRWWAMGSGIGTPDGGLVRALAVVGTNLFVGGSFTNAGNVMTDFIACWNGQQWLPVAGGLSADMSILGNTSRQGAAALAATSNELYVAGAFNSAGGHRAHDIAKWDGTAWGALTPGVNDFIWVAAPDGSNLYIAGSFTSVVGVPARSVARWDGHQWSGLGDGLGEGVIALVPAGSNVYAGGWFTNAGPLAVNGIACWDGHLWNSMEGGVSGGPYGSEVTALVRDGARLYVGGWFDNAGGILASNIAMWNGSTWSALGTGLDADVADLVMKGSDLIACGSFSRAGGVTNLGGIARWDGHQWWSLGRIDDDFRGQSIDVIAYGGGYLYAVGSALDWSLLRRVGFLARWDGQHWTLLDQTLDPGEISSLTINGSDLYMGGEWIFRDDYTSPACHLAKWDGSQWSALGSGVDGYVSGLAVSGNRLYVVGDFQMAGNKLSSYLAGWDGLSAGSDTVGDGIPDWWRQQYFGGSGTELNSTTASDADPDGDGMNNHQEFLAGTIPTERRSFLGFDSIVPEVTKSGIVLRWQSLDGKVYRLERGTNLTHNPPFDFLVRTNIPGHAPMNTETDKTAVGKGPWFYRIKLEP